MTDGKWTLSTDEERWSIGEEFDTRDEALKYAETVLAPEYGLDDGDSFWVGQIKAVTMNDIADALFDGDRVLDDVGEWLYENVGEDFTDEIVASRAQLDDLEQRLAATVREWAAVHGIQPTCFQLEHVERHTWEQCKETRPEPEPYVGHIERCVLPIEHEGDCEWP